MPDVILFRDKRTPKKKPGTATADFLIHELEKAARDVDKAIDEALRDGDTEN